MSESLIAAIALVLALGIGAEWLAWALRLPSVLVLLVAGFIAGPALGLLEPDAVLGEALLPLVSVSVAIILFEGSLSLRLADLQRTGRAVRRLLTGGLLVTWAIATVSALVLFDLDLQVAVLLGALLVVTGPTVIVPLLLHLRPSGQSGPVLRWEGIVLDPIGALLVVLAFEAINAGGFGLASAAVGLALLRTVLFGGLLGALGAAVVVLSLKRYLIPDFLHSPLALALAVAAFALSDVLQSDSGLVAVTVMGIVLANQNDVSIAHIVEFKENLRVLLISALFIILAARVDFAEMVAIAPRGLVFLAVLILVARPLSALLSTAGSRLALRERLFIAWLAPRGIVAASVASVFALKLEAIGSPGADLIVPITFLVIVGTVVVYGLSAAPVARRLGIAERNPQGVLIVGADTWVREISAALSEQGVKVLVVDSSWPHLAAARMLGLRAVYASVLSQSALDDLDLGGLGRLFALSPVDEFNSLAVLHFSPLLGRSEVYQVSPESGGSPRSQLSPRLRGRVLFGAEWTYSRLSSLFVRGATVKVTCLTEEFDYDAFRVYYGDAIVPLFVVEPSHRLQVFTEGVQLRPRAGQCLVGILDPDKDVPGEVAKLAQQEHADGTARS
jgi:NhaP-type Na+/H+ or K+/H+ antiporter